MLSSKGIVLGIQWQKNKKFNASVVQILLGVDSESEITK
jgi:hypothetical protein